LPNEEVTIWEGLKCRQDFNVVLIVKAAPNVNVNHVERNQISQMQKKTHNMTEEKEFAKYVVEKV
jgi:hypothetical protein